MIITYDDDYGLMEIECDNCGSGVEIECSDFSDGIREAKNKGWIMKKVDGDYEHYCCKECEAASEFD